MLWVGQVSGASSYFELVVRFGMSDAVGEAGEWS